MTSESLKYLYQMSRDCDTVNNSPHKTGRETRNAIQSLLSCSQCLQSTMTKFSASMFYMTITAIIVLVVLSMLISTGDCRCTETSCFKGSVCCGINGCIMGTNCLDQYCEGDSDCYRNESCCEGHCANATSCIGLHCSSDLDCSEGQSCCNHECTDSPDCVGFSCSTVSDCDKWELCCDGTCRKDCVMPTVPAVNLKDNHMPFIIGSVVGSVVFGCVVAFCVHFGICKKSTRQRSLSQQGLTVGSAPVTAYPEETVAPIHGQTPQSYQQQYPYPVSSTTTNASEKPPPYSSVPEEKSGGVNTSNPTAFPV